ncbi:hemolysin family protein [Enterovirga rhinocerotis]|uniref:CBS domain protein n=1 Tax=Enterovirga rhinocerotis TaxID=1339210 RepID=A0A4R7BST7_9HYPH|nr:hemolysin family protein [Enterovirga rhinocerotis]TDR87157.1 CBS domain protein [Enterovirga rhinocerotis]
MSDERSDPKPEPQESHRESWLERVIGRFSGRAHSARDDLEEVLSEAAEAGDLSPRERLMLKNVLAFHRVRVSDVMVPRADIVAVPAETTLGGVLALFRTAGHSRLPAYGETLDEPLGMVHIRDFLDHLAAGGTGASTEDAAADDSPRQNLAGIDLGASLAAANILRPVLFVPRSMPAIDLLARMQASRTHMALVIDEYGGTDGLVSIEDLVEMVVGDIEDEHDETEHMIVAEEAGTFLADARASIEEVSEALGEDLGLAAAHDEVDTLGGLIVTSVGRVPSRGELIAGPDGMEFEVLDADPRRLKRVRIHRRKPEDSAEGSRPSSPDSGSAA